MKDMTFQIEKIKTMREVFKAEGDMFNIDQPTWRTVISLCDVVLELLAETQMNAVRQLAVKTGNNPKSNRERKIEVMEMLQACASELDSLDLYSNAQVDVVLPIGLHEQQTITRNAGFLVRRIIHKIGEKEEI
jgi:hypothetical protein